MWMRMTMPMYPIHYNVQRQKISSSFVLHIMYKGGRNVPLDIMAQSKVLYPERELKYTLSTLEFFFLLWLFFPLKFD